jgi:dTMP kinase
MNAETGRLIVIDGIDGSGKGTQTQLLRKVLGLSGYAVETVAFPQYGQKSAGPVEEYLNGKYEQITPQAAAIFYALDRFNASFKIREWLEQGKVVLADRYVTANAGHQGGNIPDKAERIKFYRWISHLEYEIFNLPRPDLTIVLDMPPNIGQKHVDKKDKSTRGYINNKQRDILEDDLQHLHNAARAYREAAVLFPNTKLVNCTAEGRILLPGEVHNKIWELIRRIALKDFLPNN